MQRSNRGGERGNRELFTNAGETIEKEQAYRLIDGAGRGQKFIRLVISPDPSVEDTRRDLGLRALTVETIAALEGRLKTQVRFLAAVHDDQTDIRHVHVIALVNRPLNRQDCRALISSATSAAVAERRELDQEAGQTPRLTRGQGMHPLLAKAHRLGRGEPRVVLTEKGQRRNGGTSHRATVIPTGQSARTPRKCLTRL